MRRFLVLLLSCVVGSAIGGGAARAADDVSAGELRSYVTLHSIGVEWDLVGDDDHDATATVRYRFTGAPTWNAALPLVRVAAYGGNMLAGSVMFLEPGSTYDVELTLSDPDGGGAVETLALATRPVPQRPSTRSFHVEPGSGGGDGSAGDPFQGIAAAQAVAQPGDLFWVHAGDYGDSETLFDVGGDPGDYVAWVAAGDGPARFPGALRVGADHVWLEGLTVDGGTDWAMVVNGAPDDIVVARCSFSGSLNSIDLNHGGSNWTIVDNTIVGATDPASESFGGEGVEMQNTSGNTVAYNSITWVADGVSYPHTNCDVFGNDIFDTSDDGIETDLGYANVRVWGNRLHNVGHNVFSFQPQNGAPWYFVRNQMIGWREDPMKFRDTYDRFVFAHNTVVNLGDVSGVNSNGLAYGISRNNLWISIDGGRLWTIELAVDWRTDLDYDGFDWGGGDYPFRYLGNNLGDLDGFRSATGQEAHGVVIDHAACFPDLDVPGAPPTSVPPQYLVPEATGCGAVDSGQVLPNLSDGFTGSAPDLGAYEVGAPLPHYGPRPLDVGPPTSPIELTANPASDSEIQLQWSAATDDVAVVGYRIFRDGVRVGTATGTSFLDSGLAADTSYSYVVTAFDAYWYQSPPSNQASATTLGPGETPDAGPAGGDGGSPGGDGGGGGADSATGGCGCRSAPAQGGWALLLGLLCWVAIRQGWSRVVRHSPDGSRW